MKKFKLKAILLTVATVIIILFTFAAIYYPYNVIKLSSDEITTVTEFMNSRGIDVAPGIIPKTTKPMQIVTMSGEFSSPEDVSNIIFQNNYEVYNGICYSNNVSVRFAPDLFIKSNKELYGNEFKNVSEANAAKKTKKILKNFDFDIKDSLIEVYPNGNKQYRVVLTQTFNELPVFNNSLIFEVSNKGLSSVKGLIYSPDSDTYEKYRPTSPADALIQYASDESNYGTHIINITQGYKLDTDSQAKKNVKLIPVWRILTSDNKAYYIEA